MVPMVLPPLHQFSCRISFPVSYRPRPPRLPRRWYECLSVLSLEPIGTISSSPRGLKDFRRAGLFHF